MTAKEVEPKEINTIPRLPIDRAFTLSGFGTIITGTLLTGSISKEDVLEMYPIGKECRIRSIQVHGQDVDRCYAGQRVAINLSNVKKEGNPDMVYKFCSTSKVSFPGSGVAAIAASDANLVAIRKQMQIQTIGHDKLNQLRHARFYKDIHGMVEHMKLHADILLSEI